MSSKFWILIFLFTFINTTHVWAGFNEGEYRTTKSLESGVAISQSAALRILKLYNFKSETRRDYYIEIFDGQNFLLDGSPNHYKLRLKVEDQKWLLQATTGLIESPFLCGENLNLSVKRKTVEEFFVPSEDRQKITVPFETQMQSLQNRDEAATIGAIQKLDSQLRATPFPALETLMSVAGNKKFAFVGTLITQKIKSKYKFGTPEGTITFSITEGEDLLGATPLQNRYEFEFQADDTMPAENFKTAVCQIIATLNLTPEDQAPPRIDAEAMTLNKLKTLSSGPASW